MAAVFVSNLVIYTHTDFEQTFVLEDSQSNSAMNLTGYTGCAQLKRYESSSKSADFAVNFSNDRTTGRVTLEMNASVTASIKPGKYFYDLLLKNGSGSVTRIVEGTALIKKSITR